MQSVWLSAIHIVGFACVSWVLAWHVLLRERNTFFMTSPRRLSVDSSIRITLLGVMLSVVVAGIVLHNCLRREDADRARESAAVLMAQALATQYGSRSLSAPNEFRRSCERLVQDSAILAVCVLDPSSGDVVGAESEAGLLSFISGRESGEVVDSVQYEAGTTRGLAHYQRASVDLRVGGGESGPARMVFLFQISTSLDRPFQQFWQFSVPMLVVGLLGLAIGSWWLRRDVVRPIVTLVKHITSYKAHGWITEGKPVDELNVIAGSLEKLREDLGIWRDRAERIERRMDTQIAQETERITRDLKRVQREVWRDPLTGINNRRLLEERYPAIFASQCKGGHDLALVMIDLDNFKSLNDQLGHASGDKVLEFFGELLRQCLRADDVAIRYGGDEFVLLLPGVSAEQAKATAERIASLFVQRTKQMAKVEPKVTLSTGIASIWGNGASRPSDLLAMADHALYKAKEAGRDRACICSTSEFYSAQDSSRCTTRCGESTPGASSL